MIKKKSILLELQLTLTMKIYNVFQPDSFLKTPINGLTGQMNESAREVIVKNDKKFKSEDIFDKISFSEKLNIK